MRWRGWLFYWLLSVAQQETFCWLNNSTQVWSALSVFVLCHRKIKLLISTQPLRIYFRPRWDKEEPHSQNNGIILRRKMEKLCSLISLHSTPQNFKSFLGWKCTFINKEILKSNTDIRIQGPYSGEAALQKFEPPASWFDAFHSWIWGCCGALLCRTSKAQSGWMETIRPGHVWWSHSPKVLHMVSTLISSAERPRSCVNGPQAVEPSQMIERNGRAKLPGSQ